jgi:hypothetical protein
MSLAPQFGRVDPAHETTAGQERRRPGDRHGSVDPVGLTALLDEAPWWLLLARLHL